MCAKQRKISLADWKASLHRSFGRRIQIDALVVEIDMGITAPQIKRDKEESGDGKENVLDAQ